MARVLKGSHSFTCTVHTPRLYATVEPYVRHRRPAEAGTHLLTREGWKAELACIHS